MHSGNTIDFEEPADGETVDLTFTIENNGTADLKLEADGPDYVEIGDQNEAEEPFTVLSGASQSTIAPNEQEEVVIRFTGQSTSTTYSAKLLIPSNDEEHSDYYLELVGKGDGVTQE